MITRRKDGSLNMSIQAIVILVMAMAVLGLGITLINNLRERLVNLPEAPPIPNPASASEPFTTNPAKLVVKSSGEDTFVASVYNDNFFGADDLVKIGLGDCTEEIPLDVVSLSEKINLGDHVEFAVRLKGLGTTPGTYLCKLQAKVGDVAKSTKQVEIIVNA
ncbi:hypothetical protein HQ533_05130 [Candidatus Woesearchaeota archaeon]|nr:hypothetical protein [Candidatus Woesearchaeota archaeon]